LLWEHFRFFHCLKNKVLESELWCERRDDIVYKHEKGHLLGAQSAMATACLATNEVPKLICRIISSAEFLHPPDMFLLDTAILVYYACVILSPRSSSSLPFIPRAVRSSTLTPPGPHTYPTLMSFARLSIRRYEDQQHSMFLPGGTHCTSSLNVQQQAYLDEALASKALATDTHVHAILLFSSVTTLYNVPASSGRK